MRHLAQSSSILVYSHQISRCAMERRGGDTQSVSTIYHYCACLLLRVLWFWKQLSLIDIVCLTYNHLSVVIFVVCYRSRRIHTARVTALRPWDKSVYGARDSFALCHGLKTIFFEILNWSHSIKFLILNDLMFYIFFVVYIYRIHYVYFTHNTLIRLNAIA